MPGGPAILETCSPELVACAQSWPGIFEKTVCWVFSLGTPASSSASTWLRPTPCSSLPSSGFFSPLSPCRNTEPQMVLPSFSPPADHLSVPSHPTSLLRLPISHGLGQKPGLRPSPRSLRSDPQTLLWIGPHPTAFPPRDLVFPLDRPTVLV